MHTSIQTSNQVKSWQRYEKRDSPQYFTDYSKPSVYKIIETQNLKTHLFLTQNRLLDKLQISFFSFHILLFF